MKKIIAIALAALMLTSLAACDSGDSSDLTNIGDYAAPNNTYTTENGVFSFEEGTGDTAIITGYTATSTSPHAISIPETVGEDERLVVSIGKEAFREAGAYITSVTLPSTVKTIDDGAFHSCNMLTEITIPNTVTSIGKLAFYGCQSLEKVNFGEESKLTSIGDYAFVNCSALENFSFPESLVNIGDASFKNSAISKVELKNSVKTIGKQAFAECEALNYENCVILTESITEIGEYAFDIYREYVSAPEGSYALEYINKNLFEKPTDEAESK